MSVNDASSERPDESSPEVKNLLAELHTFGRYKDTIREFQSLPRESIIRELAKLLADPDADIRFDAAAVLAQIDPPATADLILPLLHDSEWIVRWQVCGLLHDFGTQRAIPHLVATLRNDPHPGVRYLAAWALGEIGDQSALDALAYARDHDSGKDREGNRIVDEAAEAIGLIQARHDLSGREPS